jgi:hypothetical protein
MTHLHWYCLSKSGMATLCKDEADAHETAAESEIEFPRESPYRAVQMLPIVNDAMPDDRLHERSLEMQQAVMAERERCAKLCDAAEASLWAVYKGDSPDDPGKRGRGSEYVQGGSDAAGALADAIRKGEA